MAIMADQTARTRRRRQIIAAGRINRPTRCTLTIPLAVLREYDYTDQAAAHADGVCARLYAIGRRMAGGTNLPILKPARPPKPGEGALSAGRGGDWR